MGFRGMGGQEMVDHLHQKRATEKHTQQESIIDQISKADAEQLMEIQKNTAEEVAEKPDLLKDPNFNRILNAIFRRAQELLGVNDTATHEHRETLH